MPAVWAELALIDDRDDCLLVGEVNQQALFARVAASCITVARVRRRRPPGPALLRWLCPGADQPYWPGRVADLGIGAAHDRATPSTESLSAALRTALTPETRARATAVAGTIRTDGATVAVRLPLDTVSLERPPASS